jgi:hypothetical protein
MSAIQVKSEPQISVERTDAIAHRRLKLPRTSLGPPDANKIPDGPVCAIKIAVVALPACATAEA